MKYPFNVIIWLIPIIAILGYFSFSSGSTLYFLITMMFFFGILIIIYPFYLKGQENLTKNKDENTVKGEVQELENWWEEAIKGKAVPQRLIEERVYSIAIEELSDRLEIKKEEIASYIEKGELEMDKNVLETLRKILMRRFNMDVPVSKAEFEKDIKTILDFVGDKNEY